MLKLCIFTISVLGLLLAVSWICLWSVIVALPDHTHLVILTVPRRCFFVDHLVIHVSCYICSHAFLSVHCSLMVNCYWYIAPQMEHSFSFFKFYMKVSSP